MKVWVLQLIPVNVELLSQELPVLPLGIGGVKGGADALTDGQGDFKGPWPCLRGDGAVWLSEKGNHSLFTLANKEKGKRYEGDCGWKSQYEDKDKNLSRQFAIYTWKAPRVAH